MVPIKSHVLQLPYLTEVQSSPDPIAQCDTNQHAGYPWTVTSHKREARPEPLIKIHFTDTIPPSDLNSELRC